MIEKEKEGFDLSLIVAMEVWSLNLKGGVPVLGVGTRMEKGLAMRQSLGWRVSSADETLGFGGLLEVKYFPARRMASYSSGFRSFELRAANKKNNPENSSPSGKDLPFISLSFILSF